MINFFNNLEQRNEPLFWFGLFCLLSALPMISAAIRRPIQLRGTNAWYKPIKFSVSIGLFCWTMGWLTYDLNLPGQVAPYSWATVVLLGFELIYITLQAARGQLSHYNQSSPVYSALYAGMALAATAVTLYTGYIGLLFCSGGFKQLPDYYLWSIRFGIFLFVIFAMEGAVMGSRLSHTIGGTDGEKSLPFLNWSRKYGDPRIAHFIGMHALQILPLLAFYILKNVAATLLFGAAYALLAVMVLLQALQGKPLFKSTLQ